MNAEKKASTAITRIYTVTNGTNADRLIEATSQAQALRYVAEKAYAVDIAAPKEIVRLMSEGVKVESAGAVAA